MTVAEAHPWGGPMARLVGLCEAACSPETLFPPPGALTGWPLDTTLWPDEGESPTCSAGLGGRPDDRGQTGGAQAQELCWSLVGGTRLGRIYRTEGDLPSGRAGPQEGIPGQGWIGGGGGQQSRPERGWNPGKLRLDALLVTLESVSSKQWAHGSSPAWGWPVRLCPWTSKTWPKLCGHHTGPRSAHQARSPSDPLRDQVVWGPGPPCSPRRGRGCSLPLQPTQVG